MAQEIERKFLLADGTWRDAVRRAEPMRQGYLAGGQGVSVRVRVVADQRAWLNVKVGGLVAARQEFDYQVPVADGRELLRAAGDTLIEKVRHHVDFEGWHWEIDEFRGANDGLVVAEIELAEVDQAFPRPPWLGAEVTRHERYYNVRLVGHPYRDWNDAERRGE